MNIRLPIFGGAKYPLWYLRNYLHDPQLHRTESGKPQHSTDTSQFNLPVTTPTGIPQGTPYLRLVPNMIITADFKPLQRPQPPKKQKHAHLKNYWSNTGAGGQEHSSSMCLLYQIKEACNPTYLTYCYPTLHSKPTNPISNNSLLTFNLTLSLPDSPVPLVILALRYFTFFWLQAVLHGDTV